MGSDDYRVYQEKCKEIIAQNIVLLHKFEEYLLRSGISGETISNHLKNMHFYLNDFLLYEDAIPAEDGYGYIGLFFDFLIRKYPGASPSSVKSSIASIRKFYKFMVSQGKINEDEYQDLLFKIKSDKEKWLEAARY